MATFFGIKKAEDCPHDLALDAAPAVSYAVSTLIDIPAAPRLRVYLTLGEE